MIYYKILIALASLWIFVYTFSYGIWEYRSKNKIGSVFVFLLAVFEIILSVYTVAVY